MGIFSIGITHAQIGINTDTPKASLDVVAFSATNQVAGVQAPRLTLNELTLKGTSIYGADQTGAIIFVTDVSSGNNNTPRTQVTATGYYYFDGTLWRPLGVPVQPEVDAVMIGDVKYSFGKADHDGWYALDGRAVSALSTTARAAASGLGFTANLPNSTDRSLKTKTAAETMGSTGGANFLTIAQGNLPSLSLAGTLSGTSGSGGSAHTHAFSGTSANGGTAHTHTYSATSGSAGVAHTHTLTATAASGGAAHTHTYSGTSASNGAHTHPSLTVPPRNAALRHRGNPAASIISIDSEQMGSTNTTGAHTHTFSATSANTTHTHTFSGASSNNTHTHTFSATTTSAAHTHTFSATSASDGGHTHALTGTATVPLGGSGTAIDNRAPFLTVNTFVYLGK